MTTPNAEPERCPRCNSHTKSAHFCVKCKATKHISECQHVVCDAPWHSTPPAPPPKKWSETCAEVQPCGHTWAQHEYFLSKALELNMTQCPAVAAPPPTCKGCEDNSPNGPAHSCHRKWKTIRNKQEAERTIPNGGTSEDASELPSPLAGVGLPSAKLSAPSSNPDWEYNTTPPAPPPSDNPSGMYCPDCRASGPGIYHCSDPEHCGGMKPMSQPIDERAAFEKCARILFPHLFSPNVPSQISKVLGAAQALKDGQERLWMLWRQARASLERK